MGTVLDSSIQYIKGVGPKRAKNLERLGIRTIEDLIYNIPWRYEDRSELKMVSDLKPGETQTIMGWVKAPVLRRTSRKRFSIFEFLLDDSTGVLKIIFFNQPFLKEIFPENKKVVLSGSVVWNRYKKYHLLMENPRFEILDSDDQDQYELLHMGRIVPIYHETPGCSSRQIRILTRLVLQKYLRSIPDILPPSIINSYKFLSLSKALENVHFPENGEDLKALNGSSSPAHHRLIFDELFLLELGLGLRKKDHEREKKNHSFKVSKELAYQFLNNLPFKLTLAQEHVIKEILDDMVKDYPMNRLLQGDVGCGKTIIGIFAILLAVENGAQAVLMAPTELLAEQHFLTLGSYLKPLGLEPFLLTSSVGKNEKEKLIEKIKSGGVKVVVGTQSLIQEDVRFKNLGLVVIDEQHKFGVLQRSVLRKKGYAPDLLIMTATPIPRTLALSVYGDLDLSVIRELPPGRNEVQTRMIYQRGLNGAYQKIENEIKNGRQAFVILPLVEESEKLDLRAATEMAKTLQEEIFPQFKVGLLHGKMPRDERLSVMNRFRAGDIHLLVGTTVVEVGIDVPNATVMLIIHAERFGLSQLHQLRGRIGRGPFSSFCLLLPQYPISEDAKRRLSAMIHFRDGFSIAEEDLAIRGPGEFLGTRQSGIPEIKIASLIRDGEILEKARYEAFQILQRDPELTVPEHQLLREEVASKWGDKLDLMNIG